MTDASVTPHSQTHNPELATWLVSFGQRRHGEEWMNKTANDLGISKKYLRMLIKGLHPFHRGHPVAKEALLVLHRERATASNLLDEYEVVK